MHQTGMRVVLAVILGLSLTVRAEVPIVHWTFDGGAATNCGSGGAEYDATLSGVAALTNGIDGGGLNFPGGSEGYAKLDYTFDDAGTLAFWFKPTRFYNHNSLFDNSVDANQWEMWIQEGPLVRFRLAAEQGDIFYDKLNSQHNSTNAWYHFAVTWDRNAATNHVRLYVNGVERKTANITTWIVPGDAVYFGGHTGNTPAEGVLDDVRVYDSALTAEAVFSVHAEVASKKPVVHITLDGTAANSGTGGAQYDAALSGAPVWTNGWNNQGQTLALDGVDDVVSVPYRLPMSGSVALWYYTPGPWYNFNSVFDNSANANYYECWIDAGGGLYFRPGAGTSWPQLTRYSLGSGSNRWHHIVGTWDALSSNIVLYVNGVERGRAVNTNGLEWPLAGTTFYVGGGNAGNSNGLGMASDLQIFETPLTSNRVTEIYGAFGRRGGLVAYLPFDGTAADVAGSNAVVVTGSPSFIRGQVGKGLSYEAAVTPGTGGSCVSVSNALGSRVGTIAFWYYARGPWYNYQPLLDNSANGDWWEGWIYEDGRLSLRINNMTGGGQPFYDLDNLRGYNSWYHIAYTWNLAEANGKLYIDGVFRSTGTLLETGWVNPDPTLRIGSFNSGNKAANGIWDEVRVYDRELTAQEILALTEIPPARGTMVLVL